MPRDAPRADEAPEVSVGASQRSEDAFVLAVDLGTSGPKVAVVSVAGRIAASSFQAVDVHLLPDGGAEQDACAWWDATVSAARRALAESAIAPEKIVGMGCTAQWSGTVACDEDGSPLRPALIWMDSRGAEPIRRQVSGPVSVLGYDIRKIARWIRLSGGAPGLSGKDPGAHILWIRENEPDVYRATFKFLEPVDWLNQRLTGRFVASHDSIVLHWVTDNRHVDAVAYDPRLCRMAGLERSKLPDLVPSASIAGSLRADVARELGVPSGIPVASGSADLHSAAVGSGAVSDFCGYLYIGTSSWISCHVPFKRTDPLRNVASVPAAIPGRYLVADEHETAGACLTFLTRSLFGTESQSRGEVEMDVYRQLDELAAKAAAGSDKVLFTPWLNGERSPVDDHTIRAGFHNLSLSTTREDLVRAVYEGVALNSRWLLGAVERFTRRRMQPLAFVGGGAKSELWAKIHADVTGRRIRPVADPVMANVRGAALLTLLALGRVRVKDISKLVEYRDLIEPDPTLGKVYDELYREFVNLYKQTRKIHRRLNTQ